MTNVARNSSLSPTGHLIANTRPFALISLRPSRSPRLLERFGYTISTLKSMASRLRADLRRGNKPPLFSLTDEDDLQDRAETATNRDPKPRRSPTIEN